MDFQVAKGVDFMIRRVLILCLTFLTVLIQGCNFSLHSPYNSYISSYPTEKLDISKIRDNIKDGGIEVNKKAELNGIEFTITHVSMDENGYYVSFEFDWANSKFHHLWLSKYTLIDDGGSHKQVSAYEWDHLKKKRGVGFVAFEKPLGDKVNFNIETAGFLVPPSSSKQISPQRSNSSSQTVSNGNIVGNVKFELPIPNQKNKGYVFIPNMTITQENISVNISRISFDKEQVVLNLSHNNKFKEYCNVELIVNGKQLHRFRSMGDRDTSVRYEQFCFGPLDEKINVIKVIIADGERIITEVGIPLEKENDN